MNSVFKAKKQMLENTLSKVAKVSVEITFARANMITISWDEENKSAFERLQNYFKGKLFWLRIRQGMRYVCLLFEFLTRRAFKSPSQLQYYDKNNQPQRRNPGAYGRKL